MGDIKTLFYVDWEKQKAFVLRRIDSFCYLHTITQFDTIPPLLGIQDQAQKLAANTMAFLEKKEALHALLWGARGCGKSSLVKATLLPHLHSGNNLRVLELDSKDILLLPLVFDTLRLLHAYRFIIFCDDLSFRIGDDSYKSIKSVLEGSLEARADNILIYATSNIRRIVESSDLDSPKDSPIIQEELSFSDRFGLQIGFYDLGTREYLECVGHFLGDATMLTSQDLASPHPLRQEALNFVTKMGGRNARIAKEFVISYQRGLV